MPTPLRFGTPLVPLSEAMFQFEDAYLRRALLEAGGVKQRAVAALGISRKCLWQKLQRHGIVSFRNGRPPNGNES